MNEKVYLLQDNIFLIIRGVVVCTVWYILRIITIERGIIENRTLGTPNDGRIFLIGTDVEETAVVDFHVSSMIQHLTVGMDLGSVGAGEAIIENNNAAAATSSEAIVFPLAGPSEFIEDQAFGTSVLDGEPFGALVVFMAH